MKVRETRRSVMIDARLRDAGGWRDAHILNMSSRGMLVRAAKAPPRGSYVEICKGSYRIVARVVWAKHDRFGVRTQDRLAIGALAGGAVSESTTAAAPRERRATPPERTAAERHERSRRRSRAAEFACAVAFGTAAAALAFDLVRDALSGPLSAVAAQLAPRG